MSATRKKKTLNVGHESTISSTMIRHSIHVYVAIMAGLFVFYTAESIDKFHQHKVVILRKLLFGDEPITVLLAFLRW